ncbi:hypothetical protein GUITHDRAFT_155409, partial [Guillardia theta CCMP2712]
MAFYQQKTQKLWGDVALHQALNGQIDGDRFHHSNRAEKDWAAAHRIKGLIGKIRGAAITGRVAI